MAAKNIMGLQTKICNLILNIIKHSDLDVLLIVDGKCVYNGIVSKELINKAVAEQKDKPVLFSKPTIPYQ